MIEIRTIPGYPMYGASADGKVWSRHTKDQSWRELVQSINGKYGYCKVNLKAERLVTKTVHILVALCFLGERPRGYDINHIDGNKANNACSNLEYCTRSNNIRHAYATGLMVPQRRPRIRGTTGKQLKLLKNTAKGERIASHKLSARQVLAIRKSRAEGRRGIDLASEFGVSAAQISRIVRGRKWTALCSDEEGTSERCFSCG